VTVRDDREGIENDQHDVDAASALLVVWDVDPIHDHDEFVDRRDRGCDRPHGSFVPKQRRGAGPATDRVAVAAKNDAYREHCGIEPFLVDGENVDAVWMNSSGTSGGSPVMKSAMSQPIIRTVPYSSTAR
jgi:hypothetical protein